jgi:cyclin-dependent kinase 7
MAKIYNNKYEEVERIGEGAFSKVYKARVVKSSVPSVPKQEKMEIETNENVDPNKMIEETKEKAAPMKPLDDFGEFVALKKIKTKIEKTGIDFSSLREIKILKEISYHPNLIRLLDVFTEQKQTILVMEHMKLDLDALIHDGRTELQEADIKSIMFQLLEGLNCLHKNWILHRDIKPGNLLFDEEGTLKIADFGSSRYYGTPDREMTAHITTRFYRPPEMLYGSKYYSAGVDIWSAGCIFAELILRRPVFPGESEIGQLSKIFALRGSPNEKTWPELLEMQNYLQFESIEKTPFTKIMPHFSEEGLDLLEKMLDINPNFRISTQDALEHAFFKSEPTMKKATYQKFINEYTKPPKKQQ